MDATDKHAAIKELLEALFSVRSVPRPYNEDKLPLRGSLEAAVRRVRGWREVVAGLRGREPGRRGTFTVGRRCQAEK
jgi:deoxyribodipyrimidine photolyase-like uncharacterized protein